MRVIRSPAVCVRAVSHLFDTKIRHERKHRIIPRLSASERSFTIDHQCARAADGQCAESSRSSSLWRGGHIKTTSTGCLSESRLSYELRKTSYRSRVLPRLVSFLLHPSFLRYKAILHIRLGHARASRCHPLVFSTDLLYSLSFSSSIHLTFSISFFVPPITLNFLYFFLFLVITDHRAFRLPPSTMYPSIVWKKQMWRSLFSPVDPVKNDTSQLSVIVTERRCASPAAIRRHGNLHT